MIQWKVNNFVQNNLIGSFLMDGCLIANINIYLDTKRLIGATLALLRD